MEKCFRCGADESQLVLHDGLYGFENVRVCESCASISGIPIIKIPTAGQLKESERGYGVRERLARLVGISLKDKTSQAIEGVRKSEKIQLEEISNPKPTNLAFKLVDNFHWIMQTTRRRRGLSARQLADNIKESQAAIELLEKGKIPGNSLDLIMKIEQFLNIKLIKREGFEAVREREEQNFVQKKQEEEREEIIIDKVREENIRRLKELAKQNDDKSIDFSRHSLHGVSVSDLKQINEQIDKDSPKKSSAQTGREQFEGFGTENMGKIKGKIVDDEKRRDMKKKTPSIYDLMKIKEEKDKQLVGRDIDIVKDKKVDIDDLE